MGKNSWTDVLLQLVQGFPNLFLPYRDQWIVCIGTVYAGTSLLQIPNKDINEDNAKIYLIELDSEFVLILI